VRAAVAYHGGHEAGADTGAHFGQPVTGIEAGRNGDEREAHDEHAVGGVQGRGRGEKNGVHYGQAGREKEGAGERAVTEAAEVTVGAAENELEGKCAVSYGQKCSEGNWGVGVGGVCYGQTVRGEVNGGGSGRSGESGGSGRSGESGGSGNLNGRVVLKSEFSSSGLGVRVHQYTAIPGATPPARVGAQLQPTMSPLVAPPVSPRL